MSETTGTYQANPHANQAEDRKLYHTTEYEFMPGGSTRISREVFALTVLSDWNTIYPNNSPNVAYETKVIDVPVAGEGVVPTPAELIEIVSGLANPRTPGLTFSECGGVLKSYQSESGVSVVEFAPPNGFVVEYAMPDD